jgi:mannitol 2-dehydrogenase
MDGDVTPLLADVPGIDLEAYKDCLLERFSNTAIGDQLSRIGYDGSSRLPKFIIPTLLERIEAGASLHRLALILAAWCHYQQGVDENGDAFEVADLRLDQMQSAARPGVDQVKRFLGLEEVFGQALPKSPLFVEAFRLQLDRLQRLGARGTLKLTMADEQ